MQAHKQICCGRAREHKRAAPLLSESWDDAGHTEQAGHWAVFCVCALGTFVTDSRMIWPLCETSEKLEPICIYQCPHLFNILEDLSY